MIYRRIRTVGMFLVRLMLRILNMFLSVVSFQCSFCFHCKSIALLRILMKYGTLNLSRTVENCAGNTHSTRYSNEFNLVLKLKEAYLTTFLVDNFQFTPCVCTFPIVHCDTVSHIIFLAEMAQDDSRTK